MGMLLHRHDTVQIEAEIKEAVKEVKETKETKEPKKTAKPRKK